MEEEEEEEEGLWRRRRRRWTRFSRPQGRHDHQRRRQCRRQSLMTLS